jgi:phenylalanyl-tRNA synthetase beta chain
VLDPAFFPGRAATIFYRPSPTKDTIGTITNRDTEIGSLGILHPTVLEKYEIAYPCSSLEFSLEPFKKGVESLSV